MVATICESLRGKKARSQVEGQWLAVCGLAVALCEGHKSRLSEHIVRSITCFATHSAFVDSHGTGSSVIHILETPKRKEVWDGNMRRSRRHGDALN